MKHDITVSTDHGGAITRAIGEVELDYFGGYQLGGNTA